MPFPVACAPAPSANCVSVGSVCAHVRRTKCDGFKYVARLQALVPSYVATVGESVRRGLFSRLVTSSSGTFASALSQLVADERKRRGVYQAEHHEKVPWVMPGLDEPLPSIEMDSRPHNHRAASAGTPPATGTGAGTVTGPQRPQHPLTVGDLEELATSLREIEASLAPEDLTPSGLSHPVSDANAMAKKLLDQIHAIQSDFDALDARLAQDGATAAQAKAAIEAETARADDLARHNEELMQQIRALEGQRKELQRELERERDLREDGVSEHNARRAELDEAVTRATEERNAERQAAEGLRREMAELEERRNATLGELEEEKHGAAQLQKRVVELEELVSETERRTAQDDFQGRFERLQDAHNELSDTIEIKVRLVVDLESELEKERALSEQRERALQDYKQEAEVDRATLEHEIKEEKERSAAQKRELQRALDATMSELDVARQHGKEKDQELLEMAELQVMFNARAKTIASMEAEAARSDAATRVLLNLFKLFYDAHVASIRAFVEEPAIVSASGTGSGRGAAPALTPNLDGNATATLAPASAMRTALASSSPASPPFQLPAVPPFDASDIASAVSSLEKHDAGVLASLARGRSEAYAKEVRKWIKECKRYKLRAIMATEAAKEKLAFRRWVDIASLPCSYRPN